MFQFSDPLAQRVFLGQIHLTQKLFLILPLKPNRPFCDLKLPAHSLHFIKALIIRTLIMLILANDSLFKYFQNFPRVRPAHLVPQNFAAFHKIIETALCVCIEIDTVL
jgi:hypothetical protein